MPKVAGGNKDMQKRKKGDTTTHIICGNKWKSVHLVAKKIVSESREKKGRGLIMDLEREGRDKHRARPLSKNSRRELNKDKEKG